MQSRWIWLLILAAPLSGCGHSGHQRNAGANTQEKRKGESEAERAERVRLEAAIKQKQAADAARFEKDLTVIRATMPGDTYADFYRKAGEARLSLERVTRIEDGTVERYSFMDNSTAFIVVTVKADHIREIVYEGVNP